MYLVSSTVADSILIDLIMYSGAHNARAPDTNATQVNPADDSMKLLLQHSVQHMKLLPNHSII